MRRQLTTQRRVNGRLQRISGGAVPTHWADEDTREEYKPAVMPYKPMYLSSRAQQPTQEVKVKAAPAGEEPYPAEEQYSQAYSAQDTPKSDKEVEREREKIRAQITHLLTKDLKAKGSGLRIFS